MVATEEAWSPREIARRVQQSGVSKARADVLGTLLLSVLAGAYIALGGMLFLVVTVHSQLGWGPTRLLGGAAFSLGLVLVVVAGAELFTGNNLISMAWASKLVTTRELLRNWGVVYAGNVLGALGTVLLVSLAGTAELGDGTLRATVLSVAHTKLALDPLQAVARGVLCNALVCLAVWISMGGRSVIDRVVGVALPITAFVALGFEHSIANWFFLPLAWVLEADGVGIGVQDALASIWWVTLGNVIGGTLLVAGVYWTAYLRKGQGS